MSEDTSMKIVELNPPAIIASPLSHKIMMVEDRPMRGRPVKYNQPVITKDYRGANGELVIAILYESQCPFCGKRVSFPGDVKSVQCPHCKRGTDQSEKDEFDLTDFFCKPGDFDEPVRYNDTRAWKTRQRAEREEAEKLAKMAEGGQINQLDKLDIK